MVQIKFIDVANSVHEVEATEGLSLMEAATRNGVPGIEAQCGGACSCATCHVYIDTSWQGAVGGPSEVESTMLEYAADVEHGSRLSCQIIVTAKMNGMTVRLPRTQGSEF